MTSQLRFVDKIDASPTVRLNLADGSTFALVRDGTDFPPPPLRRSINQTLLTDGAVIPAAAYDLRRVTLDLTVTGTDADATATALQALYRELDRPGGNVLLWQHETTHPVFFRTFRTSVAAVNERVGRSDGRRKRIEVDLLAQPFAYGLPETPVSAVTVDANPAAGTNPCYVDVTGVKGDVETPALIRWPSASIADGREVLTAVRRRGTPSGAPFLFQAEAMTQGTDTTTQANDANFSGAGNNYSRCTFTTATMQTRLSTLDLGTASVDLRGRYRVLARYRKNTSTDDINLQLQWGDADGWVSVDNDKYITVDTNLITTADLGEISVPAGVDPVRDPLTGADMVVSDSFFLGLRAERTAGAGTLDVDFLLLLPADDRLAVVHFNEESSSPSDHWMLDAATNNPHARDASGQVISAGAAGVAGGFPMLSPNQTNRVYLLRSVRPADIWPLTTVTPVSISYTPRYLSVRPAST